MERVLFDWPFAALAGALLGGFVLVVMPWHPGPRWRDPRWLVCLMLPAYMLHQFEEYGIDLLGRRFHFMRDMCAVLGYVDLHRCPAQPPFFFAVNVGGVWLAGALAIAFRKRNLLVGACAFGIPLVNAVAHVVGSIKMGAYGSGTLTGVLLFVPLCMVVLTRLWQAGILDRKRFVGVVASGVLVHAVLMTSVLAHAKGWIGVPLLLTINVANGLLPCAIGMAFARPAPVASVDATRIT